MWITGRKLLRQKLVETPSETDSIKSQISPKTSRGTVQKTPSHHQRQQVNSNFPYKWSPASLTYLASIFNYIYIHI